MQCPISAVSHTQFPQLLSQVLAFYQQLGMPLPEVPPLMLVETSALNAAEDKEGRSQGHSHGPVFHTRGLTLTAEYRAIQYVTTRRGRITTQPMNLSDRDRYEVRLPRLALPRLALPCLALPAVPLYESSSSNLLALASVPLYESANSNLPALA